MAISESEFARIRNKVLNITGNDYEQGINVNGNINASGSIIINGNIEAGNGSLRTNGDIGSPNDVYLGSDKNVILSPALGNVYVNKYLKVGPNLSNPINSSEIAQYGMSGDCYIRVTDATASVVLGTSMGYSITPFVGTFTNHEFNIRTNNTPRLSIGSTADLGDTYPSTDNTYSIGIPTKRWQDLWALNATIQTSDSRQKTEINDCDLGIEFIEKLRPVSYKFTNRKNIVSSSLKIIEGVEVFEETLTPTIGVRTHYGLIAQDISSVLQGKDFAGFIYDSGSDSYGLRYNEFIAPVIKAIQQLSEKIKYLEQKLSGSI